MGNQQCCGNGPNEDTRQNNPALAKKKKKGIKKGDRKGSVQIGFTIETGPKNSFMLDSEGEDRQRNHSDNFSMLDHNRMSAQTTDEYQPT